LLLFHFQQPVIFQVCSFFVPRCSTAGRRGKGKLVPGQGGSRERQWKIHRKMGLEKQQQWKELTKKATLYELLSIYGLNNIDFSAKDDLTRADCDPARIRKSMKIEL
jgi:hypothetical protein